MLDRSVVCPGCEEPLPHGRLSCPRCGAPLASVAGAFRAPARTTVRDRSAADASWPSLRVAPQAMRGGLEGDLDDAAEPPPPGEPVPPDAPTTGPGPEPQVLPSDLPAPMTSPALPADEIVPAGAPADVDDVSEPAPPDVDVPPDATAIGGRGPVPGEAAPWPALRAATIRRLPMADGVHVVGPVVSAPQPATGGPGPAGAYLPPTDPVMLAAGDTTRDPRAWALVPSTGASEALRAEPGPRAAPTLDPVTTTNMTAAVPSVRRPVADLLADLPFCVPDDAVARVVAAASATAALAFLLPWTNAPLVGRGGYTAGWGLASSSYLIPWLLVVVLLLVSLLPDRTPPSIRAGAVPLAVGGLLLGLVWPHVLGPAGSHVGSLLTAAAAAALIAAGLVALQPARRGGSAPPV